MKTWNQALNGHSTSWLRGRTVFLTRHGSHAYGLATPESDEDIKGVCIAPHSYYFGFLNHFEQAESREPDLVVYEWTKFFKLAADANPNIVEVLWTDPEDHLLATPTGDALLSIRDTFLSRKARYTFSGYAHAQLGRIQRHYRWLKNPPKAPPTREKFGLPEKKLIDHNQLGAADGLVRHKVESWDIDLEPLDRPSRIALQAKLITVLGEILHYSGVPSHISQLKDRLELCAARAVGYDNNFIDVLQREKAYINALREWQHYQDWLKNRNPQRAELERKFSFDSKHGMHLVRLLRMCREILEKGEVQVKRPDREELLAIRNHGAWTYEQLVEWAERQDREMDEVMLSSPLPKSPPRQRLDEFCISWASRAAPEGALYSWA